MGQQDKSSTQRHSHSTSFQVSLGYLLLDGVNMGKGVWQIQVLRATGNQMGY